MSRFLSSGLSTLSSIRNQLTELTTEVLNESTQEVADPVTELSVAKKRVIDLEQALATRNSEVETLRASNSELQERVSTFEYELHQAAERYRRQTEEKEAEILRLQSVSLSHPLTSSETSVIHGSESFSPPLSPSGYHFDRRNLEEEIKHLKAECQHWKHLVKQYKEGEAGTGSRGNDEAARLRCEVETLQRRLEELVECHQNELASLQEFHTTQLSAISRSYENKENRQEADEWGATSDWNTDDWNTLETEKEKTSSPRNIERAGSKEMESGERVELQHQINLLQSENKNLGEVNATLQRSLEDLDKQHAAAIEQLLSGREEFARQLKEELINTKEELSAMKQWKETVADKDAKANDADLENETLNDTIQGLKNEVAVLTQELDSHQETLDGTKRECALELRSMKEEADKVQQEKNALQQEKEQLAAQCKELSFAYNELNELYENEKSKSGAAIGDSHELNRKLESLKRDLLEYEEKYERCKNDNLQSMKQLEALTTELGRLKTEYFTANAAHAQTKKWHEEIVRLSRELEESLKKREELVKSVQEFQGLVDRFDQQIKRFKTENEKLRRENEELRTASGASSPTDFRRVFEVTDQELQVLRRSLSEYQDAFVKKEKVWRDQVEALKEENETLKTRTPSSPGSGRESDSGGEVMSSGSASYVHIEMGTADGTVPGGNGGQPSPHSGSNDSNGVLVVESMRRDSRDIMFLEEEGRGTGDWNALETDKEQTATPSNIKRTESKEMEASERVEFQRQMYILQSENKSLREDNVTLQRSLEDLDKQHAAAIEQLLSGREELENAARHLEEALNNTKEELAAMKQWKEIADNKDAEVNDANLKCEMLNDTIQELKNEVAVLSQELEEHQETVDRTKREYDLEIRSMREQTDNVQQEKNGLQQEKEEIAAQCQQWYYAYNELKEVYENEKSRSGAAIGDSQELNKKLESLQRDLLEYEEKYESCKNDNLQTKNAVQQENDHLSGQYKELSFAYNELKQSYENGLMEAVRGKERTEQELDAMTGESASLRQQLTEIQDTCQRQSKENERLRAHLLQMEDAYTQEAIHAEERETELRKRLREVEQQLEAYLENAKDGTQKLSDQIADLRTELQAMAEQRDSALLQYADSQIDLERQQKAVGNLQAVLQHMQQERDLMSMNEVERYKRERDAIKGEKQVLEDRLREVQNQLIECQRNLNAISTISEQAGAKDRIMAELKAQINTKEDECAALHTKLNELQRARDAKIDKDVLKNIFLGYFCAPVGKQPEVAHLLGAILGFSDEEFKKISSGAGSGGWLQFLRLSSGTSHTAVGKSAEQSLAAQFVKFLETESAPKPPATSMSTASMSPSVPVSAGGRIGGRPGAPSVGSRSTTPGLSHQLPTFLSPASADGTGSSDFLKDLLAKPAGEGNVI